MCAAKLLEDREIDSFLLVGQRNQQRISLLLRQPLLEAMGEDKLWPLQCEDWVHFFA
jgi:hypothetical protein